MVTIPYFDDNSFGGNRQNNGGQINYMQIKANFMPDIEFGNLEGTVELIGGPGNVQNVQIHVGNQIIYPDSTGFFSTQLPAGIYDVLFSYSGYGPQNVTSITINAGMVTNLGTIQLYYEGLEPPTNLTYEIQNETDVLLEWNTPYGIESRDFLGYNIYRDNEQINNNLIIDTTYADLGLDEGTYEYYVTAVYDEGESVPTNTVEVTIDYNANDNKIEVTKLNHNFPNPFSNSTNISFSLKNDSRVKISIYNVKGQLVSQLINTQLSGNKIHNYSWDGTHNGKPVSNGIYYYKLETENKTCMEKMILMR